MASAPDHRREALRKIGKFAAYAAPLTLLLLPEKTKAGVPSSIPS